MDDQILDPILEPIIKSFLGQMDSAMKVSETLADHASSEEITVDHIITGLVYRLMVPMSNEEVDSALESAQQILDKLDENIDFGSRKVKAPICNCSVCAKARVCLLNYQTYDCSDPLADKFKAAINSTCGKHKIYI